ncbi:MAG: SDR family NAD(P)-dependent oxidoreductase [Deltaproteobacteria bacterium]|jgi:NAD(P)-dependent dehydrogenase (short-subunit alcohol dehydrogenase family)
MEVKDKVAIVTGGANGIGAALCRRLAQEGAKAVVVSDTDLKTAKTLADEIGGLAVRCDVGREEEIVELVRVTDEKFGSVDLFFSNAGIMIQGLLDVSDEDWERIWQINVMSHVYAGRAVIPGMLKRGTGGFIITASAAGLLNQIDSLPYTTTKHAAVGVADNFAINYGDRGIQVSVICPMAVRSLMTRNGGGIAALDGMLEAEQVAEDVMVALNEGRYMIMPHAQVKDYLERKASNYDRWVRGMQRLRATHLPDL